jgi:hypothetical protein
MALAQNNTQIGSVSLGIGQKAVDFDMGGVSPAAERWYWIWPQQGQSYCVETGLAESQGYYKADPLLAIYRASETAAFATNDDSFGEPQLGHGSRICWISVDSTVVYIQVRPHPSSNPSNNATVYAVYSLRTVETTMWSSWFFQGGDYNSFVLLRNTTNLGVNFKITWRNPSNAVVGTYAGYVVGGAGVGVNSKTYIPDPVTNYYGTVEIAHDGSPDALVGQMTSLSATTGLGFDAPFFQRRPW